MPTCSPHCPHARLGVICVGGMSRPFAVFAMALLVLVLRLPSAVAAGESVISEKALARSLAWLEAHPPDPAADPLGDVCLDVWAWYLFATLHPDAAVRRHAGNETDRRLRALPPPEAVTVVSASYWAVLLRLLQLRGIDGDSHRIPLTRGDLAGAIQTATPTTRFWTAEFLRRANIHVMEPDFSETFIAVGTATPSPAYAPNTRDAYRLFHELVPMTDFGREAPARLHSDHVAFVRRVLPGLLEVSITAGDTDAAAEVLVSAALMGQRNTSAYQKGIAWLLARQGPAGTYASARDRNSPQEPNRFRHVVLVASYAVLTSF